MPQGRMSFMMICTTNYVNIDNNFLKNFFIVDMAKSLSIHAPITLEQLWATLKPTNATTPGPDGISKTKFKKLRDTIVNAWNLRCKL
jgi:hypothetical protein